MNGSCRSSEVGSAGSCVAEVCVLSQAASPRRAQLSGSLLAASVFPLAAPRAPGGLFETPIPNQIPPQPLGRLLGFHPFAQRLGLGLTACLMACGSGGPRLRFSAKRVSFSLLVAVASQPCVCAHTRTHVQTHADVYTHAHTRTCAHYSTCTQARTATTMCTRAHRHICTHSPGTAL